MKNPLIAPILSILGKKTAAISEHQLLVELNQGGQFTMITADNDNVVLFQRHFLIMNALYYLQDQLWLDGLLLRISPLAIIIENNRSITTTSMPVEQGVQQSLKAYYSDFSHFQSTGAAEVEALLNGFWQRYYATDQVLSAFSRLGLDEQASWSEVKNSYRRLARQSHPDNGGDVEAFIVVREAYELLRQSMPQ